MLEDNATYSTTLYTSEAVRMIGHHDRTKGPFFLYAAYQAVHGPLEAPQRYLDQCGQVTEYMRHIFCGMVLALDDGVGNITRALQGSRLLDNTVIALTTDNVSVITLWDGCGLGALTLGVVYLRRAVKTE